MKNKLIGKTIIAGALCAALVIPSFANAQDLSVRTIAAEDLQISPTRNIFNQWYLKYINILLRNYDAVKPVENGIAKGNFETRASYEIKDNKVVFNFELMSHYTKAKTLTFGSGQQFEVTITDEKGEEVYRYSDGKFFTMALVYKNIGPGEAIKWQTEWDMTNKEGEKLISGKYKAKIDILANSEIEKIQEKELTTIIDFSLVEVQRDKESISYTEEGIIKPEFAKKIIENTSDKLINAIKNKESEVLSAFIHPVKGLRFTPYTNVSLKGDVVFSGEKMRKFFEDQQVYLWGHYDGTGDEIRLTASKYYDKFIYSEDFTAAEKVGYNEVLSSGNMLENQFDVYENPIVVEYYFSGFNPDYQGIDWKSLRLVFEEYEGSWKLVGIIHNQWTI